MLESVAIFSAAAASAASASNHNLRIDVVRRRAGWLAPNQHRLIYELSGLNIGPQPA
jgi:hypothetical protein